MKRLIVVAAAMAALLSLGAGQAVAGNHSGPEALAKGTGSVNAGPTTTTTDINRQICDYTGFCYGNYPVAQTVVDTTTSESFDFDAHSGPHTLTPLDPTDGPQGTMKLTYSSSTTTSVVAGPYYSLCSDPYFVIIGGCPTLVAPTTVTKNAQVTAEVTCLQVVNNTAAIGGHVTRFSGDFAPTRGLLFNGVDNTVAGNQVVPDLFDAAFVADAPQECPAPSGGHPIGSGDVYVDQS
jgi:hypothetical protein